MLLKVAMWTVELQKDKNMSRCSSAFEKFTVEASALLINSNFVKLKCLVAVNVDMLRGWKRINVCDKNNASK